MGGEKTTNKPSVHKHISIGHSAMNSMYLLITFIAVFAIFSGQTMFGSVRADGDASILGANDKNPHEHSPSLTSDTDLIDANHYLPEIEIGVSDVEVVPGLSGNETIGKRSGRQLTYDDNYNNYMGQLDTFEPNNYDYGE